MIVFQDRKEVIRYLLFDAHQTNRRVNNKLKCVFMSLSILLNPLLRLSVLYTCFVHLRSVFGFHVRNQ
jgi:hypothetical protein